MKNLTILGVRNVCDITNLSKPTIYRKMSEGTFPLALRLSVNRVGWRKCDIDFWIENLPQSIGRVDQ
jgi:prophage regulatory protein